MHNYSNQREITVQWCVYYSETNQEDLKLMMTQPSKSCNYTDCLAVPGRLNQTIEEISTTPQNCMSH